MQTAKKIIYKKNNKTKKNSCKILNNIQKEILHLYFGIAYIIINNDHVKNENKVKLLEQKLYYGKTNKDNKILNTSRSFTEIDKCNVFFNSSLDEIYKFIEINENNYKHLCIFFNHGYVQYYKNKISVSEYLYVDEIIVNNNMLNKHIIIIIYIIIFH